MKPANLKTKIFLDSGDPAETRDALSILGFLDGQTTNPSLIAKNPQTAGKKFSKQELFNFYRGVVEQVSSLIPQGSVSIEVYADEKTSANDMLAQGREFYKWIPNAHIKYPTTKEGLKAAEISVKEGMRVNMTLVFSQLQAAAVYAATRGAIPGQVFLSPFIGRLDDIGQKGMDLIANILKMYSSGDSHVEVLTASVRSLDHFMEAIRLGSQIITTPYKILKQWADGGLKLPDQNFAYHPANLKPIPFQEIDLNKNWQEYNIYHQLTDKGIEKFAADWNQLIA
jgi:transaldolase